jgi:hypothetical protein
MIYEMFGITELVRYVDDQFCHRKDIARVTEACEAYGYTCKAPENILATGALGLKVGDDGTFSRMKALPKLSDYGRAQPTTKDILSLIGRYRSHFPIEGWLRPAMLAIQRAITITKRKIDLVKFMSKFGRKPRPQKVHPAVLELCRILEEQVEEKGDPVRGQFQFNIEEPWTVAIDSSIFAHGAMMFIGKVLVEDATWSLRDQERWKTLANDRNVNVLELEGCARSIAEHSADQKVLPNRRVSQTVDKGRQTNTEGDGYTD